MNTECVQVILGIGSSSTSMGEGDIMRALVLLWFLLLPGLVPGLARADEPTITVTVGKDTRSFTRGELLARAGRSHHKGGA